jgi:hypothetical protein
MRGEIIKTEEQKYKEYLGLYKQYSNELIKRKLKINDVLLLKFLTAAVKESRVEADRPIIKSEKAPFSENEMDYGTVRSTKWPKKYENAPITEPAVTDLMLAIKTYKIVLKK